MANRKNSEKRTARPSAARVFGAAGALLDARRADEEHDPELRRAAGGAWEAIAELLRVVRDRQVRDGGERKGEENGR